MIDLLSVLQGVLQQDGYFTRLVSIEGSSILSFEDDTLMGFGIIFSSPLELLAHWRATETTLLNRYAPTIRSAGDKAWNVYLVCLCGQVASPSNDREVRWVEEDLERTRKLAACGVLSRDDLVRAVQPILQLRHQPSLEASDVSERVKARIGSLAPRASKVVLDESVSPAEVVRLLGEPA
jgi:hypothetical protein